MEKEIDLGKLVAVLWKGKYIILVITIAASFLVGVYGYFMIKPVYKAETFIKLEPLNVSSAVLIQTAQSAAHSQSLVDSVIDLIEDPGNLSLLIADVAVVSIQVSGHDPHNIFLAANKVGEALLDLAVKRFDFGKVDLLDEKKRLEQKLLFFDEEIEALYDEIRQPDKVSLNPLDDSAGFEILEKQRAEILTKLLEVRIRLRELEIVGDIALQELLFPGPFPHNPINVGWNVNAIIAALAGFMLSVLIVLLRFFFTESLTVKKLHQKNDSLK